jgi:predicted site-specific integrase-resolvase
MFNTNDYMPAAVAAERLGIRRSALYAAIKRGHFHPVDVYGSGWVSVEEVEAYRRYTQPDGKKATGRPRKVREEQ